MSVAKGPVLVVVSYYDARPLQDLDALLHDLGSVPAGWPFEVLVVVNQERAEPTAIAAKLPGLRVLHRANTGYNIGAWDHGWRSAPGHDVYLFLQHECRIRQPGWLRPFVLHLQQPGVGLVGERSNPAWDAPWDEIERRFEGHALPDHHVDGEPAPRIATYRHFFARNGIDAGPRGDHLQALVLAARGEILTRIDGFPIGANYGEAIAAEVGISKRVQGLGLRVEEVGPRPFTWIGHPQWDERARKQPRRAPRLGLQRWLESVREQKLFDDRPWLVLGKGPTFARLSDEHRATHHLFGLNHVVREVPLAIAHAIDIDVVAACREVLVDHCRFLLMPRVPHVDSVPGTKLLEQYFDELPELFELERSNRLVWYNCSTASAAYAGSPVLEVRYFSSEAAFGILAAMGVRTIRTLGIDGGRRYSPSFSDLAGTTRLQNGQPMFDLQFERIASIVARHGIHYAPLCPPIRIQIRGDDGLRIAAAVLEFSIRKHTSFPLAIEHVPSHATAPDGALLVDAGSLACGDVASGRDGDTAWLLPCADRAPWLQPDGENAAAWFDMFAEAVNAGVVSPATVRAAVRRGHAGRHLLLIPPPVPPARGDELARVEHRASTLRRELANVRLSRTWQAGTLLARPALFARRLARRCIPVSVRSWFAPAAAANGAAVAAPPGATTFSVVTTDTHALRAVDRSHVEVVAGHESARSEFTVWLEPGVLPTADAFVELAAAVARRPDADFVFSDEAGADGDSWHKPGWSPALLLAQPYACRLAAIRTSLVARLGGPRPEFGAAAHYDLVLRATAAARSVVHVPKVLCRSARADAPGEDHARAAAAAAAAMGLDATIMPADRVPVLRVSVRPRERRAVTVIVPTRDKLDLLKPCVDSVLEKTDYPGLRVMIVDNGSAEPATLAQFDEWRADPRITILRDDSPFDYAALMNKAVAATDTPLVLLLNNDTVVISPAWLDELAGWLDLPDVGAVGAKLYYGDDTIQHGGVVLGVGGVAAHCHKFFARSAPGYHGLLHCVRDLSAVTGACMLIRRDLYVQLGGLDPALRIAFNDVDFCLRVCKAGYRVIWTPLAELYHLEGKSRGKDFRGKPRFEGEISFMKARWGGLLLADPFHNPNFSLRSPDYRLR